MANVATTTCECTLDVLQAAVCTVARLHSARVGTGYAPSLRQMPLPGWNNTKVTVSMTATDAGGAGVKQISYSSTGAQVVSAVVQGSSALVTITPSVVSQAQHMAKPSHRKDRLKAAWTPASKQRWQTEEPIRMTWEYT
jgi:hypothetical protein